MSDGPKRGRPLTATDTELTATGEGTKAQIAKLFRRDAKTMDRLLYGLIPSGMRRGHAVYSIEEAAGRLVKPGYAIESYIRRMHHTDLPPLLQKEFWNGLRARQAYEKEQGDLWPTSEVLAVYAEAANTIRMALLLMPDAVDREASLTTKQKEVLKRLTDAAIVDIQEKLVDKFAGYEPPDVIGAGLLPIGIGHNGGPRIPDGGPASGYDSILDAPDHEEEGLRLRDVGGDAMLDLDEDTLAPGTPLDL
jgi:hypothetical protein